MKTDGMPPRRRKSGEVTTSEANPERPTTSGNENENEAANPEPAKKKSRSGQRKKAPASAEALKKRNENAPANATVENEGGEDDERAGDLFDLLQSSGQAVVLTAGEWRKRYGESEISAIAEIYSLLCKASGCSTGVTAIELQRSDCLTIMNRIVTDMAAGSLYGEDPLSRRSNDFKGFRDNFLDFIDKAMRESAESEQLYDGTLFASWAEIVITCAGSKARPLRMAATTMALQTITSLITVVNNLQTSRDLKQNQIEIESKKAKSDVEVLKSLNRIIDSAQEQIELVEKYIQELFTKVFTHRFRDCDESIRAACMTALGKWMMKHQLVFLTDFYLKYLGWSLNDKSASVRLEVLVALKGLAGSSSHLAMMDTFIGRFRPRMAEMLQDVSTEVVVEAIRLAAVLHEHTELDQEHMNVVTSLIMDKNPSIRTAAARATKTLMPTLTEKYRRNRKLRYKSGETTAALDEIHGIAQLMLDFGEESNTQGKIIEGLSGVYKVLSNVQFIAKLLDSDMAVEDASLFANILILTIRKSMGEDVSKPYNKSRSRQSAKVRNAISKAHEEISKTMTSDNLLASLMTKYQAEADVVAPLVECVRFIKLEHYVLKHEELAFTLLSEQIRDLFFKHSDKRTLEACGEAFNYFCNEGFEATATFAQPALDGAVADLSSKLTAALTKVQSLMSKADSTVENEDEGHAFELRMSLARLRALISKCNISTSVDVLSELSNYVSTVARSSCAGKESTAMACSSISFSLIWQALELMDGETTTTAQVNDHIRERNEFLSDVMNILRRASDMFEDGDTLRRSLISTICDMVLYYYNSSTLPMAHPARELRLKLSETDSAEVWEHCRQLIAPEDAHQDADLDAARLAYRMAVHDERINENGSLGSDFLSNFKVTGPWIDAAIRTYCNDLRRTGPQILVRAVLTALRGAYVDILSSDLGERQTLLEAFTDLATRLSDMFSLSSKRDRLLMRIMFDEGVRSVLLPEPVYDRFAFLLYGLGPFLPKFSAVDAKALSPIVDDAIAKVDSEDSRAAPLIDFADQLSARSKGASDRRRAPPGQSTAEAAPVEDDIEDADADDSKQNLDDGPTDPMQEGSTRRRR